MKKLLISLRLLSVLTVLTGIAYPSLITFVGKAAFPEMRHGSMIIRKGQVVGSSLVGQKFTQEKYFWGRPSATDYDALPSGGSNLAPTSQKLVELSAAQAKRFEGVHAIPGDLMFASASGIDPHITVESALLQVERVIAARGWGATMTDAILTLVREHTAPQQLGFLGEKRVNVLELNLALDELR